MVCVDAPAGSMIALLLASRSSPAPLLTWGVIGLCAGIYLFFHGFSLLQRRRLILDTPFSKIRSAAMGMVEVSGLAIGPYTVVAPITARPCYFYRTLVWEYKQQGKNKQWVRVAGECMHVPFFVDDNSGRVLVDPRGADLDLHRDFEQEFCDSFFTTKDPAPANVRSFLARHGIATSNKIKVEECCVKPKNSLFILGTLAENPGLEVAPQAVNDDQALTSADSSFTFGHGSLSFSVAAGRGNLSASSFAQGITARSNTVSRVVQLAPDQAKALDMTQRQKITAALLKAGISNPAAWAEAGVAAPAVQVVADASLSTGQSEGNPASELKAGGFDPHPPVVLMKGENDKTFIISWRSQQEVARSLGWKCTLMIWGGPVLALLGVYILIEALKLF